MTNQPRVWDEAAQNQAADRLWNSPASVTLRQGESISLVTGMIDSLCPVAPATEVALANEALATAGLSGFLITRLGANDLHALRSALELTACGWTPEACHSYVDHCPQHPRVRYAPDSPETLYVEHVTA